MEDSEWSHSTDGTGVPSSFASAIRFSNSLFCVNAPNRMTALSSSSNLENYKTSIAGRMITLGIDATEVFLTRLKGRPIGDDGHYKRALLFFLCKALKTSRAIALLQQAGFPEDAQILSRTVYELRLQALYLADDPKTRVPQFRAHEQNSQMKGLKKVPRKR